MRNAWFLFSARTGLLLGIGLALAGLLPVLYFIALLAWQYSVRLAGGSAVPLPATLWFVDHSPLRDGKAAPVLDFIPEFPSAWLMDPQAWLPAHAVAMWVLDRLHLGLVPAVLGLAVMALGSRIALRELAVLRAARRHRQERLRRARHYRRDSRLEPFIGEGIGTGGDATSAPQRGFRRTARG